MKTNEQCPYPCKQEDEIKENCSFQGKVLATLHAIEKDIKEIKENGKGELKDVWEAINKVREDIKTLYWKVGIISGGTAFITSLITAIAVTLLRGVRG